MKIEVYEYTDGEAYDGFTKVTKHQLHFNREGLVDKTKPLVTTLRRVQSRYGYNKKPLPVNYKAIQKSQVVTALRSAKYGLQYVSINGDDMIQHHGIKRKEYQETL